MTLYFQRHDGHAVTCDDFAQAIADANPESKLAQLLPQFKRWYSQAGTPRVQGDRPLRRRLAHLQPDPVAKLPAPRRARPRRSRSSSRSAWACSHPMAAS